MHEKIKTLLGVAGRAENPKPDNYIILLKCSAIDRFFIKLEDKDATKPSKC